VAFLATTSFLVVGCNSSDLQSQKGGKETADAEIKESEAEVESDLRVIPPEVVSGSYLTCSPVDPVKAAPGQNIDPSEAVFGCVAVNSESNSKIDLSGLRTNWTITSEEGESIAKRQLQLPPEHPLHFAAAVQQRFVNKGLRVLVDLAGVNQTRASMNGQLIPGVCEYAPLCELTIRSEAARAQSGACLAESDGFDNDDGGCEVKELRLVVSRQAAFRDGRSRASFREAWAWCEGLKDGDKSDWKLPSSDHIQKLMKIEGIRSVLPLDFELSWWSRISWSQVGIATSGRVCGSDGSECKSASGSDQRHGVFCVRSSERGSSNR